MPENIRPTLSVIIPAYNAEKYLTECVQSILKQPCKDVEIIIVNDGSSDETPRIADQLADQYGNIHVLHLENGGVSRARNRGISVSKGIYIGFLDADDVWCKDAYTEDIKMTLVSQAKDMVGFAYFQTDEKLKYGQSFPESSREIDHSCSEYNLYYTRQKPFFSYFFKRTLLNDVRFPEGVRYGEDISFLFLATRLAKSILLMDRYLMMYRTNSNSIMYHTDDFNFMLETIDGLYQTKKLAKTEEHCLDFDGRIHKMMYEYLRLSSRNGKSYKILHEDLMNCKPFWETWKNLGRYEATAETTEFIKLFEKEPKIAWKKMRKQGFLQYTARSFVRKSIFRKLFFRMKFKMNVTEYRINT